MRRALRWVLRLNLTKQERQRCRWWAASAAGAAAVLTGPVLQWPVAAQCLSAGLGALVAVEVRRVQLRQSAASGR